MIMEQWPKYSVRGYLSRLPVYKLEWILRRKNQSGCEVLTEDDYVFVQDLLSRRLGKEGLGKDNDGN